MSRARYHFSGVGGAGMSPLARLMRTRGHAVQGSDRAFDTGGNREAADALRAAGGARAADRAAGRRAAPRAGGLNHTLGREPGAVAPPGGPSAAAAAGGGRLVGPAGRRGRAGRGRGAKGETTGRPTGEVG